MSPVPRALIAVSLLIAAASAGPSTRLAGQTAAPYWTAPELFLIHKPILQDADGDGDVDIIIDQGPRVLVNDGHGRFVGRTIPRTNPKVQMDVVARDVNGDRVVDFILGSVPSTPASTIILLVSQRDGSYRDESPSRFPSNMPDGRPLAWEDFTGNGRGDLLILDHSGRLHLLTAAPNGTFVDISSQSIPRGMPLGGFELYVPAAVADFDGDGDLDVHIPNRRQDPLLVNNGQGAFSLSQYASYDEFSRESFFEDFDRDGDLDLFVLAATAQAVQYRLFLNQGGGRLNRHSWTLPWGNTVWAGVGDLTGDGFPELVLRTYTRSAGDTMQIISISTGLRATDISKDFLPPLFAPSAPTLLADFDNDGDLDIFSFFVNRHPSMLLANTRTQTIAPMASPIGNPTFVSTHGPAGTSTVTAVSAASTVTPLGNLGDLRLDPQGLLIPFAGNIGTSRELKFPFAVPNNPWLRGKKLWFQSLHLAPNSPRLTNSTWTTFR